MGLRDSIQEMALPLRDKLKKGAGPYLEPEEQIQAVSWRSGQRCNTTTARWSRPKNSVARAWYASLRCQMRSR
jgi:hypothetical protein